MTLPSKAEVKTYIEDLKNWGRWGPDDQLGTLNLIAPEHRTAAARLVTEGRTVSCSRDLVTAYGHPDNCAQMYYVASGERVGPADGARKGRSRVGGGVRRTRVPPRR
jgi:hypothetical protein